MDARIQRALRAVESRSIGSHRIVLVEDERVQRTPRCHVLYLGESAALAEGSIRAFQASGALVISDAAFEGCIRFAKEGSRLGLLLLTSAGASRTNYLKLGPAQDCQERAR